jgi:hypothetical protein
MDVESVSSEDVATILLTPDARPFNGPFPRRFRVPLETFFVVEFEHSNSQRLIHVRHHTPRNRVWVHQIHKIDSTSTYGGNARKRKRTVERDARIKHFFVQQAHNSCAIAAVYNYLAYIGVLRDPRSMFEGHFQYKKICERHSRKHGCRYGIPVTMVPGYLDDEVTQYIDGEWRLLDSDSGDNIESIRAEIRKLLDADQPFVLAYNGHAVVAIGYLLGDRERIEVIDSDNHSSGIGIRSIADIFGKKVLRVAYLLGKT